MKLLHVISSIDPKTGGTIEGLLLTCHELHGMGISVEIACLNAPGDFQEQVEAYPWPVYRLGPARLGTYAYSPAFRRWMDANVCRYDAVVIHGMWQYHGFATSRACRKHGVPYFIYAHGMLDPWFNRTYPWKKLKKSLYWFWGEHPVLSHASAVLFTADEERLLARQSFSPYRVTEQVVGYGCRAPDETVLLKTDAFQAANATWARQPYFLFLGRIQEKKGLDLLIGAYAALRREDTSIPDLVIAGPVQQHAYADHLRTAFPQEGIHWVGSITGPDKWCLLASAEALTLVSHQENFGIVVAEALSVGTPVLISNKINIWREVEGGGGGFVQDDTVKGALSLLKQWTALSVEERTQMRRAARRVFNDHFEINRATERLVATIRHSLGDQNK